MDYQTAKKHIYQNMYMNLFIAIADDDIQKGIALIKEETTCDEPTAKCIWCDLKMDYGTKETNPIIKARENYQNEKLFQEYPYCHSKNTKKISGLSKVGSVALWGVFAVGKVSKQWHCNNCGSEW